MKRFVLRWALAGLIASVFTLILPEIIGPSIMYLLPFIFLLSPSFAIVFYIFPLHGAPIAIAIGIYLVLILVNMLIYAGIAAMLWVLLAKQK